MQCVFNLKILKQIVKVLNLKKKRSDLGNVCGPSKFPAPLVNVFGVFQIVKNIVNVFFFEKKGLDLVNVLLTFEISRTSRKRFLVFSNREKHSKRFYFRKKKTN